MTLGWEVAGLGKMDLSVFLGVTMKKLRVGAMSMSWLVKRGFSDLLTAAC